MRQPSNEAYSKRSGVASALSRQRRRVHRRQWPRRLARAPLPDVPRVGGVAAQREDARAVRRQRELLRVRLIARDHRLDRRAIHRGAQQVHAAAPLRQRIDPRAIRRPGRLPRFRAGDVVVHPHLGGEVAPGQQVAGRRRPRAQSPSARRCSTSGRVSSGSPDRRCARRRATRRAARRRASRW